MNRRAGWFLVPYLMIWGVASLIYAVVGQRPTVRPDVITSAARYADSCARAWGYAHGVPPVVYRTFAPGSHPLGARVIGEWRPGDGRAPDTVLVDTIYKDTVWAVAHELLHGAVGRPGHPFAFVACGLMTWQHAPVADGACAGVLCKGGR